MAHNYYHQAAPYSSVSAAPPPLPDHPICMKLMAGQKAGTPSRRRGTLPISEDVCCSRASDGQIWTKWAPGSQRPEQEITGAARRGKTRQSEEQTRTGHPEKSQGNQSGCNRKGELISDGSQGTRKWMKSLLRSAEILRNAGESRSP